MHSSNTNDMPETLLQACVSFMSTNPTCTSVNIKKTQMKRQYEIRCLLKRVYSFKITKDSETEAFNVGVCTGMHEDGFNTIGSIF